MFQLFNQIARDKGVKLELGVCSTGYSIFITTDVKIKLKTSGCYGIYDNTFNFSELDGKPLDPDPGSGSKIQCIWIHNSSYR